MSNAQIVKLIYGQNKYIGRYMSNTQIVKVIYDYNKNIVSAYLATSSHWIFDTWYLFDLNKKA